MRFLCIGDSNTYGYDPRSCLGGRYPSDVRWTERLGHWEVVNCGMNGLCIPRSGRAYADLIRAKSPDLAAVMLGSNDLLQGGDAWTVTARMDAFLSELKQAGTPLLLIAPPPIRMGEWVREARLVAESEKLGALYCELAESRGLLFADAGEWNVELSFDGVHFTPAGHAAFAAGLKRELDRYLMENRETERENVIKHDNR